MGTLVREGTTNEILGVNIASDDGASFATREMNGADSTALGIRDKELCPANA